MLQAAAKLSIDLPSRDRFLIGHYMEFAEIVKRFINGWRKLGQASQIIELMTLHSGHPTA